MVNRTLDLNIERDLQDKQASIGQDLIATTANIIGASYKGAAFVPKKIVSDTEIIDLEEDAETVYNTYPKTIGTSRQNRHEHLYDDYSCNINSDAYDAISIWMENGGTQSTFTRVLGAGTAIKDTNTGKMIGSGFNASNNISSGTLTHTVSPNLNAINNGVEGNVSFIFKTINEISKRSDNSDNSDVSTVDYLGEIFYGLKNKDQTPEVNILSDVIIFASGVLPDLTDTSLGDDPDEFFNYSTTASSYASQNKQTVDKNQNFIKLSGFKPYNEPSARKPFSFIQDSFLNTTNYLQKQETYSSLDKNYFPSRLLEKGHFTYASFPFGGINDSTSNHKRFTVLTSKKHADVISGFAGDAQNLPDYNSFESEYTTSKTPWVTSQPLNRSDILDNRTKINEKVQDLFRFWALDDGEVGNKYRIKINPTRRGLPNIETNFKKENADDDFATFDVYVFMYEPRNNSYSAIETFKDLNLHPDSPRYIANIIGDEHEYYDFQLKKAVKRGFYKNKSQHLRVEVHSDIDEKSFKNQHEIIPSGFRSYPYIKFEKNAFKNFWGNDATLDTLFDTQGVYQLPPLYVLNRYGEYAASHLVNDINNHWGIVFNRPRITNNNMQPFAFRPYNDTIKREISPHFYYTKYFLNGITGTHEYRNIWKEDDNYLNSFFHLEKILVKTNLDGSKELDKYKHSGRVPSDSTNYSYLNLSGDEIWESNRKLKPAYKQQLSFDFFTYGGFDGVDLRDNDKRFFRNDAIVREFYDANEKKCTYESYNIAIDIATDSSYCAGDILVVPGIKEIPIVEKCVQKCEKDRQYFYLADISGASSNDVIVNYIDSRVGKNNKVVISAKGVSGQNFIIENDLSNYSLNMSKITSNDTRFVLKGEHDPNNGDSLTHYEYKTVLENNYETIHSSWLSKDITSRYLFPTYGDVIALFEDDSEKQISSEVFVLGKIAQKANSIDDILGSTSLNLHGGIATFNLILGNRLNRASETFEDELKEFRKSSTNIIYAPLDEPIQLLTQLTSYDNRKSIFQEQKFVRTIQEIKKRIKYNLFIDETLISGGALFSQNSSLENLYQKLDIQLKNLMQLFLEEGLITGYRVDIKRAEDSGTILDMQNYIIRGNIVLQFGRSNIIKLQLDEILSELSLLANPDQDTVYIPRSIN